MRKLKILFFAADPYSLPPRNEPRLRLDEDIRQIYEKIRLSKYRDAVELHYRLAARLDDLFQALNEVGPDVVHFSGHGWREGVIVMDPKGAGPQRLDVSYLTDLFRTFRGDIRLVLLNACDSESQADAIADIVGCAIGMRGKISDRAAIAFGAAFYRAIGFGHSVQTAFDQGRLAIGPSAERNVPQRAHRKDVDPTQLVLVPPRPPREAPPPPPAPARRKWKRWQKWAITLLAVAAAAVGVVVVPAKFFPLDRSPKCGWDQNGLPQLTSGGPPPRVATSTSGATAYSTELEIAEAQQRAGNDTAAFRHFSKAAQAGSTEAMAYLGVAYLCGEGTPRRTDRAITLLREAAGRRDMRAMIALAFAYQYGIGVKHNRRWTRFWYRTAADTTHSAEAMRRLGGSYADDEKWDSAVIWYRRAIDAGSVHAMVDLGSLYQHRPSARQDPELARALHDSAARGEPTRRRR